jgi:hypothetical protein
MKMQALLVIVTLVALGSPARAAGETAEVVTAEVTPSAPRGPVVRLIGELGFLAPLAHTIQFSKDGTRFDYVDEGGQDNLFFAARLSAELLLARRHAIILLYQPLNLQSEVLLGRDVLVDGQLFPADTGVRLRYGFDFYRVSYLYDFFGDNPRLEVSIGGSLQIRNATIDFRASDGSALRTRRDIGPVPALKARARYAFLCGAFLGLEVDGMYAPVKYLNARGSDVVGAIIDLSLRAGFAVTPRLDAFLNLRYLGGGAEGTGSRSKGPGDGFTANWLHFLTVTLGFQWSLGATPLS